MSYIRTIFRYYVSILFLFFVGRLFLLALYFPQIEEFSFLEYINIFIYGVRMDTILISFLLLIPLVLITVSNLYNQKLLTTLFKYYTLIIVSMLIFIEIATFPYLDQYNVRPNYIFVEYLGFPEQILSMVVKDYLFELILAIFALIVFTTIFIKKFDDDFMNKFIYDSKKTKIFSFVFIFLLLFLGARSSIGSRPANISDALWSHNRMANEITKNSLHSVLTDVYRNIKYKDDRALAKQYGKIDIDTAFKNVKNLLNIKDTNSNKDLNRIVNSHFKYKESKNIVIILEESLGARFVEAVGGEKGLTPYLNKLSQEGLLFTNAYSNGTRSNRALVGLSTGFLAIPGEQLLKRNKAQSDFFSIAKLLKPYNYQTIFMYGGESRFDNMGNFFMGNGFHHIIEEKDFENPQHKGVWGVSDEDLFTRANEEFKSMYEKEQKFASLVFTLSNHAPFDIPKNKVTPYKGDEPHLKTAIKYADYALGRFFDMAKKEAYFKDTIFVVLADHNIRFTSTGMVPVSEFQIPALIISESLTPSKYNEIVTQPDILATTLDLAGLNLKYPILGNSIFSEDKKNFAFLQFHKNYAFLKDDKVAILRPNKKIVNFNYKNKEIIETDKEDKILNSEALSLVNVIEHMYQNRLYK